VKEKKRKKKVVAGQLTIRNAELAAARSLAVGLVPKPARDDKDF